MSRAAQRRKAHEVSVGVAFCVRGGGVQTGFLAREGRSRPLSTFGTNVPFDNRKRLPFLAIC